MKTNMLVRLLKGLVSRIALVVAIAVAALVPAKSFGAFSAVLKGQHKGATNWVNGPLSDWGELDYVPVQVLLKDGPRTNQVVTINFDHTKVASSLVGIEAFYEFTNSSNVQIVSPPVLNAPQNADIWSYTLTINYTDSADGSLEFKARLSAGFHLFTGSALSMSGSPSLGQLQISKPAACPDSPDVAIVKTGATNVAPGAIITYTLAYTNRATAIAFSKGVQMSDVLPNTNFVSFIPGSMTGTATNFYLIGNGNTIVWDLGNLLPGEGGSVSFQCQISSNTPSGTIIANLARLLSCNNDASPADDQMTLNTTIFANTAPAATNDAYVVNEDVLLNIAVAGVLANDGDFDADGLTAVLVATTTNGVLTLNANGSFTYLPNTNFNGVDHFTYQANDGTTNSSIATVTITVNGVNDAPVANNDSYSLNEDQLLSVALAGVLTNDTDIDGNALTAVLVATTTNGSLTLNANGSFTYLPNTNFNGVDSFTYRANDGSANSGIATVTLTINGVNDAPTGNVDNYTINEEGTLIVPVISGVLSNDVDIETNILIAVLIDAPTNGTFAFNTNGSFQYTPPTNFNGTVTFTYVPTDGSATGAVVTVTLTINAVNDAPLAVSQSVTTPEDTATNIVVGGSDVEGSALTFAILTGPSSGLISGFNSSSGAFTYTPNTNFNGADTIQFTVSDGSLLATGTVSITVSPVNDTPVGTDDFYILNEDGMLNVPMPGVLTNDMDVETNVLTAVLVSGPSSGLLILDKDGSFNFTPVTNFNGVVTFTYVATEGSATSSVVTVTLTVNAVNDAPLAVSQSVTTPEDTATNIVVGGSDVDGSTLTFAILTAPTNGLVSGFNGNTGAFTYTPNTNFNGADTISFTVSDGSLLATGIVNITVSPVNDTPVGNVDNYTINEEGTLTVPALSGVLTNDVDVETNLLTAILISAPTNGTFTFSTNGSFEYIPPTNFNGTVTFTYVPTDGSATGAVVTVTLTINAVNDAPLAVSQSVTTPEDTATNIVVGGSDVEGSALTFAILTGPANGLISGFNGNTGAFTYTPNTNFNGADTIAFTVSDGSLLATGIVSITVSPVNDTPVGNVDNYTINEEGTLIVPVISGVLSNDVDIETNILIAVLIDAPTNGTFAFNTNGSFQYTPPTNFNGTVTFTYVPTDGSATGAVVTVTLTINAVNDAPLAVSQSVTTPEDTATNIVVGGSDVEGSALTFAILTGPSSGLISGFNSSSGAFTYTPNTNFNGADTIQFTVSDGSLLATGTVSITVSPVNDTPVGNVDSYTINEEGTLTVPAVSGVLTNDVDVETNLLTSILISAPTNGTFTLSTNGSFQYIPPTNFNGTVTFTYAPTDGSATGAVVTVTVTVNAVNDAPVGNNDSYTLNEDGVLNVLIPGVLTNDTDVEMQSLTAVLVSAPSSGSLTFNANGSFSYAPVTNFNGVVTFTYVATDGSATSGVVTVTLTINAVNDAPVSTNDNYSVAESGTLNPNAALGVLANDSDVETNSLTAVIVSSTSNGSLTLNPDGSFNYVHNGSETTSDSFTYRANDGLLNSGVATVTITITSVSDAPVANNDSYTIAEAGTLIRNAALGVLANDTDAETNSLNAILIAGPSNGTLTLNSDGSFTYAHNGSETTSDSFTYRANDGLLNSGIATVSITITSVNDAPVANNDSYNLAEGGTSNPNAAAGVLANDTDAETNSLTVVLVSGPSNGSLTLNTNGSFTYTHNGGETASDSFTYRANDGLLDSGIATVNFTITSVNDAPVANNDSYNVPEGGTLIRDAASGVLDNDTDAETNVLSAILISGPTNGILTLNANGSFSYMHDGSETTNDSFTYRANDGLLDSGIATVTIAISSVNNAPVANNDNYSIAEGGTLNPNAATGVLANDTDAETNSLTANLVSGVSNGTLMLNSDGSFTYVHNGSETTSDNFTYRANDGLLDSGVVTVTITITSVNNAPVANNDSYTVAEGGTLNPNASLGVLVNDTDAETNSLTASLVSGPSNGSLLLNADGSFTYTHNGSETVSDSFTYQANDGATNSGIATVNITITSVNDAPMANNDSYTVAEGGILDPGALLGVLANDTDAETNSLTAVLVSGPSNGLLTLNPDGSFTYTHNGSETTNDSFTYRVNDGATNSGIATVNITITSVNDAPVANNDSYSVAEGGILNPNAALGVLANDTDAETNSLNAILVSGPSNGSLLLNPDGSFTYTHNGSETTNDSFTYRANDGTTNSGIATVNINVTPVNDAPVANNDPYTIGEGGTLTLNALVGILANDTDAETNALTAVLVSGLSNGTLTLNPDGSLTYNHNGSETTSDSFTYQANDGLLNSGIATVSITITAVNDAPVANNDSYTVTEGGTLNPSAVLGVLANDSDAETNSITASLVSGTSNGTLTFNSDGSFTYVHNGSETTNDSFTYRVTDGLLNSGVATVNITITSANDAPVANNDSYSVGQNDSLFVSAPGVLANDTDSETNSLNAILVTGPVNGGLTLNANGSFSYTPNLSFIGSDSFTYRANDGSADSGTATVTITITQTDLIGFVSAIRLNQQSGLFEQTVQITNATSSTFTAVRVLVNNLLPTGVRVYNASGTNAGVPFVQYNVPIASNTVANLTIEYYSPTRVMPTCTLTAEVVSATPPPNPVGSPLAIDRALQMTNGNFLIDFSTISNRTYYIQYSSDTEIWKTATPSINGTGSRMQWIDNGPPKTESSPANEASRFYRVLLVP